MTQLANIDQIHAVDGDVDEIYDLMGPPAYLEARATLFTHETSRKGGYVNLWARTEGGRVAKAAEVERVKGKEKEKRRRRARELKRGVERKKRGKGKRKEPIRDEEGRFARSKGWERQKFRGRNR